jgi:hypothetical protein
MSSETELFDSEVPAPVQERILRAVHFGCREAHEEALKYGPYRLVDAVPYLRRLKVEDHIEKLLFGPGFTLRRYGTPSSTYLQIENARIVMTSLTRTNEVDSVSLYNYRTTLARSSQGELFTKPDPVPAGAKLYALLIYGGPFRRKGATQCRIVFPLADGTGKFHEEEIDLLARFPMITPEEKYTPVTGSADVRFIPVEEEEESGD